MPSLPPDSASATCDDVHRPSGNHLHCDDNTVSATVFSSHSTDTRTTLIHSMDMKASSNPATVELHDLALSADGQGDSTRTETSPSLGYLAKLVTDLSEDRITYDALVRMHVEKCYRYERLQKQMEDQLTMQQQLRIDHATLCSELAEVKCERDTYLDKLNVLEDDDSNLGNGDDAVAERVQEVDTILTLLIKRISCLNIRTSISKVLTGNDHFCFLSCFEISFITCVQSLVLERKLPMCYFHFFLLCHFLFT